MTLSNSSSSGGGNGNSSGDGSGYDLREVGVPSRNILHVRGGGSKSRFRVAGDAAGAAAQKVT